MQHHDQQYERLLARAWNAVQDAREVADNQGRKDHTRQLRYLARVLTEIQGDVERTELVLGARGREHQRRTRAGTTQMAAERQKSD